MMSELVVKEIQIIPVKLNNGLVAFVSFVINNQFYMGNIALYTSPSSPDGYRLVYPVRALSNGAKLPLVHPINRETGFAVQEIIIEEYIKLMEDLTKGNIPDEYEPRTP